MYLIKLTTIIQENTTANYIYLITRGQCTETVKETSFDFKQKLSLSSIVSYHQIICGRSRYLSSNIVLFYLIKYHFEAVMADSMVYAVKINLQKVKDKLKKDTRVI